MNLKAEQFCSVNWTYTSSFRQILQISDDMRFPVDRCAACGFVYARLLPSVEFLSRVYDEIISQEKCLSASEDRLNIAGRMRYLALTLEAAPHKKALNALDFGCGLGTSLKLLSAAGITAIGFDPSWLRTTVVEKAGYIMVRDEEELKKNAPYDIVICDNVLEHVAEPVETVDFLASLCKKESVLYVSTPEYEDYWVEDQLKAFRRGMPLDMSLNPWEHLNYFDLAHLDSILAEQGFSPVDARDLGGPVDIGLRPEQSTVMRIKNSMASVLRVMRYAATGVGARSVINALYRFTRSAE